MYFYYNINYSIIQVGGENTKTIIVNREEINDDSELDLFIKKALELEKAVQEAVKDPDSWKYIPDSAVYLDNDNVIRLIKTNEKVGVIGDNRNMW